VPQQTDNSKRYTAPPKLGGSRHGRQVYIYDPTIQAVRSARLPDIRKRDSHGFRLPNHGCAPEQVPEWKAEFGHLGVDFDPATGDAIFDSRAAVRRFLKARSEGFAHGQRRYVNRDISD